jgi:dihydrorhizobitoxine desaturase
MNTTTQQNRRFRTYKFVSEIESALKSMSTPSSKSAFFAVLEDWIVIALGALLTLWGWQMTCPIWLLALLAGWILIGTRMRGLATLLHESSHKALSKNHALNFAFGTVCSGWWILQRWHRYHQSHVTEHHPFLGNEQRDPDTMQYVSQGLPRENPDTFIIKNVLQLLTGIKAIVNLPYLLRDRLLPAKGSKLTKQEWLELAGFVLAWISLLAILAWNSWFDEFVLVWVIPYLTVFQAANWLIETSEHFPLIWTESASINQTRNRKGSALENFFFGIHGENWHKIHHLRPGIPFWRLAEAHEIMMRDPIYAEAEGRTGGLLMSGKNGAPSILKAMVAELREYQATTGHLPNTPLKLA